MGEPNVEKMLRGMSSVRWVEWKTFMTLTPFVMDQERADIRAALIAMTLWNIAIAKGTKKGHQPDYKKIHEFLTQWGDTPKFEPPRLSAKRQFESIVNAFESMGFQPVGRKE